MNGGEVDWLERGVTAGAVAAAAVLFLLLGYPMLLGQVYVDTDLGRYHLPLRHFHAESLARGDAYLWCPYEWTGFYLHGEGQLGLYHPLNWLQFRWLPFAAAFNLEILRSYAVALLGAFALLRRWQLGRAGSLFGALCFAWSSFLVCYFMHPNFVLIAAHLPWLLLAIDATLRGSPRARAVAWPGTALVCASMLLLGHPQATWMVLAVGALYTAFLVIRRIPRATAGMAWVGLAVLAGFLVAGVQLVPQAESAQRSARVTPSERFRSSIALPPADLAAQLVAPHAPLPRTRRLPPQSRVVHAGAGALVLWLWLMLCGRRLPPSRRALLAAASCLSVLGAVLALGDAGGLYRLQRFLPVVGLFRAPARYSLFIVFGLSVISAVAVDDLVRRRGAGERLPGSRRWLLAVPLLAGVAWMALAGASLEAFALVAGLLTLYTGIVLGAAAGFHAALLALPLVLLADLGVHTWRCVRIDRPAPVSLQRLAEREPPPELDPGLRALGPEHWVMHRVRLAGGYLSMAPQRELPLGRIFRGPPDPLTQRALELGAVGVREGQRLAPLPRVRLVSEAVVGQVRDELTRIDVGRVALVEESVALGGGPPGQARVLRDRPGDIEVEVRAPARQLLVLSESYHPGWRAQVGERACPLLRVYGDLMGCIVEPGDRSVAFRFEPQSLRVGRAVSAGGLLLAALGTGLLFLRARAASGELDGP